MPPNNDEPKRIFDVAKPGKTAADAQSKPVIVGHRTLLQDPMVTPTSSEPATEETAKPDQAPVEPLASTGHTITPPDTGTAPASAQTPDTPTTTQPDIATLDSEEAPKETALTPAQQGEAETAKQEALHKLVEGKKYYVPIGEKKHKRSIRRLLIAVIIGLVAIIVLGDLFIGSGFIKTSIKPPLTIFHRN